MFLSRAIEAPGASRAISPRSRGIIARISALSALDSLGGGFLVGTLISFYFFKRFDVDEAGLAALFTAGAAVQAVSFPVAAWLARRIGLVNTMVFTHIPSSLILMAVPFAPTFMVAVALWLVREFLVEMDVPTRQSYIAAVVAPEERPVAAGVTNLVRLGAWAVGAPLGGAAMRLLAPAAHLYIGGAIKIVYDLSLWFAFRRLKPPEEVSR
jgi:predicted MFS family arabinose efflux permease